ncbi:MAG: hypothetical protein Alpg2KO_25040 [Alphaproteobacteria bacterium]
MTPVPEAAHSKPGKRKDWGRRDKLFNNALGLFVVLIVALCWRYLTPHSLFFEARPLRIEQDASKRVGVAIYYDRDVHVGFEGTFTVDLYSLDRPDDNPICWGSDTKQYKPGKYRPGRSVDIDWYMAPRHSTRCPDQLKPGRYELITCWSFLWLRPLCQRDDLPLVIEPTPQK